MIAAGAALALVGVVVHFAGARWIDWLMPPIVTGAIVSLIGFNLAPAAWGNVKQAPVTAIVTIVTVLLVTVLFKGVIGRLSILIGVVVGYITAVLRGEVNFDAISSAGWVGVPHFRAPDFDVTLLAYSCPSCSC
ncbi:Putative pyrimidine permease RutG [Trueperella pyogenes]|nr:Putative pyrimidine permease RutG [Trueperella pyogenes]